MSDPATVKRAVYGHARGAAFEVTANRGLYWLLLCFVAVHVLFLALDVRFPSAFMRGDRAAHRMATFDDLHRLGDWHAVIAYLGSHGNPGDYAPQAALYAMGGRPALVISQICLMLLSGICAFRVARRCKLSARAGYLAAGLYLASPHSLVLPHQLCTEGFFVPLVAISTWATIEALGRSSRVALICAALLSGMATLIRPVILLWPVIVAFGLRRFGGRTPAAAFAAAAYAPMVLWIVFVWQQTGTPGMGDSDHSLAFNLYGRVEAIAATMPPDKRGAIAARYLAGARTSEVAPSQYLSFIVHYPVPFLVYAARDAEVFLFKSGIERITVDYLADDQQAKMLQSRDGSGWRQEWDKHGALSAIRYGWRVLGVTFVTSVIASIAQVALILLAVIGAVELFGLIRQPAGEQASKLAELLVLSLPIYFLIFSQLADANQSRHRAPAEFAIAILVTHGLRRVRSAWRSRTMQRQSQTAEC